MAGPRASARRYRCSGVGVRTGLVAATDSTSLLTELAPPHPTRRHTGSPDRDSFAWSTPQFPPRRVYCPGARDGARDAASEHRTITCPALLPGFPPSGVFLGGPDLKG